MALSATGKGATYGLSGRRAAACSEDDYQCTVPESVG